MKKILSVLLALMMIMSLATVCAADEQTGNTGAAMAAADSVDLRAKAADELVVEFYKTYTGNAAELELYPVEELNLTAAVYPEGQEGAPAISVVDKKTDDAAFSTLSFKIGAANKPGKYTYKITENVPETQTQGVVYTAADEATEILATVWVYYRTDDEGNYVDYNDEIVTENADRVLMKAVTFYGVDAEGKPVEKVNEIQNEYNVYNLEVKKTISGALASDTQEFDVTVTFIIEDGKALAENAVITYGDEEITASDFEEGVATAEIKLVADETVTFENIPDGISYVVEESEEHIGDADAYINDPAKGYTVTYKESNEGQIDGDDVSVIINNEKSVDIKTGVITESAPYVLLIAVCAVAVVFFVIKRRNSYEF